MRQSIIGGGGGFRTPDPRLMSPLLYHLSYTATERVCTKGLRVTSSVREGSNICDTGLEILPCVWNEFSEGIVSPTKRDVIRLGLDGDDPKGGSARP